MSIEHRQDDKSKLQQEENDEDMEESDKDKSSWLDAYTYYI